MKLKADLHVHTLGSRDAFTSIKRAVEAASARGLDALAITDHETQTNVDRVPLPAGSVVLLSGVEVKAGRYHVLGIGVREWESVKCGDLTEAAARIHEAGGLAVLAHPYLSPFRPPSLKEMRDAKVDALETLNSTVQFFSFGTRLASRAASSLRLPRTAGSDSHIPETIGDAYTILETVAKRSDEILDAIREGRTEPCGGPTRLRHRLRKIRLQLQGGRPADGG